MLYAVQAVLFVLGGLGEQYVKYGIGAKQRLKGKKGFHFGLFLEVIAYIPYFLFTLWHLITYPSYGLSSGVQLILGILVIIVGITINLLAVRELKVARWNSAHVFGVADELKSLVTTGIYSRVRHPSYLGQIIFLFGCVLVVPIPQVVTLAITYCLYMLFIHIRIEEKYLASQFGKEFYAYKNRVGAMLPVKFL